MDELGLGLGDLIGWPATALQSKIVYRENLRREPRQYPNW